MAHTPGPWGFLERTVLDSRNIRLAKTEWRGMGGTAVAVDNARLIAAAPELLEACHDVKNFLANLENGTRRDDPLHALRLMVHKPLHAVLDAAIAKATGKT